MFFADPVFPDDFEKVEDLSKLPHWNWRQEVEGASEATRTIPSNPQEYVTLLAKAGFTVERVVPTASPVSIVAATIA